MRQSGERLRQPSADATGATLVRWPQTAGGGQEVVSVPIMSLRTADSPRLNGEDKTHIARLAETETPLPPILVDSRTMRVIDGMHRLMAASLRGRETIDAIFFDGSEADVFLRAVEENISHGLPLSQADRRAAAERIIASHPHMSDRAIAHSAGLAAKTVAAIRMRSSEGLPQSNTRVGRDGRIRPLDSGMGRLRAAELLTEQPGASLRNVARVAGISPATVLDVRKRLQRGESPVPEKPAAAERRTSASGSGIGTPTGLGPGPGASTGAGTGAGPAGGGAESAAEGGRPRADSAAPAAPLRLASRAASVAAAAPDPASTVEKLLRDPSLRNNERGRSMLRLLHVNAVGAGQLADVAGDVPPHCVAIVVQLAGHYAKMWQEFARELDGRARIIDPSAVNR